jgi:maltose alpha-D-glucosyltransferase/alpha-amylase
VIEQLKQARWFGGKSRLMLDVRVVDRARWVEQAEMNLVEVHYERGSPESYVIAEGIDDPPIARALLSQFRGTRVATEAGGELAFRPSHLFASIASQATEPIALLRGEQSNTSVRYGNALILKLFRRLQFGPNPDVEVGRFLTEQTDFRGTPAVVGSLDYTSPTGSTASLALLQRFVPNRGDAWTSTLRRLAAVVNGASIEEGVEAMARLGRTTADLHLALANGGGDFSAEQIDAGDVSAWLEAIHDEVRLATDGLTRRNIDVDTAKLLRRAAGIASLEGAQKARHHGDYHLGQILEADDGEFVIIDFEGEPSKPLAQRREKHSPLRDVAGLLRSLDYARHAALRAHDRLTAEQIRRVAAWHDAAREAFLRSYLDTVRRHRPELLPADVLPPLAALELLKAAYEVTYELNNRPDWLPIPLAALQTSDTL